MRLDIHEPGLDFGDAGWVARNFRLAHQRLALAIGFQDDLDQLFRSVRRFLCETADLPARRYGDGAGFGRQVTTNGMKQRRLADAVAADEAHACARCNLYRAVVDQKPSGNPDRDIVDGQHAGFSPQPLQNATCIWMRRPENITCLNAISGHRPRRAFAVHRRDAGDRVKSLIPGAVLAGGVRPQHRRSIGWTCDRAVRRRLRLDFS